LLVDATTVFGEKPERPSGSERAGLNTLLLYFARSPQPAGADGSGLQRGTCGLANRTFRDEDPAVLEFDTPADLKTVEDFFRNQNHYFSLPVENHQWVFATVRVIEAGELARAEESQSPGKLELAKRGGQLQEPAGGPLSRNRTAKAVLDPKLGKKGAPADGAIVNPKDEAIGSSHGELNSADTVGSTVVQGRADRADQITSATNAAADRADAASMNPQPLPPKPSPPDPGSPVVQGASHASAAVAAASLPKNLFEMDDRAIIIIGGKQVAAGDVKRDILQHIERTAGPAKTFAVPARPQLPETPLSARSASSGTSQALQSSTTGTLGERILARGQYDWDCSKGPFAGRIDGRLRPGEPLKVTGACFGTLPGSIELIGQFHPRQPESGRLKLEVYSWYEAEIVAATPRDVREVPDHVVTLTVIRRDGRQSAAKQLNFIAARERVEVPANFWTPMSHYTWNAVGKNNWNLIRGHNNQGSGQFPSQPCPNTFAVDSGCGPASVFRLRVNPACALDNMEVSEKLGQVLNIVGWENGQPFEANITVFWQPHHAWSTTDYWVARSTEEVYSVDFTLRAWANCPIGINP
jgi:hypothetical protein